LAREVRSSTERVAHADVALAVHPDAAHPRVEPIGRIGALLVEVRVALLFEPELVPTDAAAARRGGIGL
jgi:hypothetical protein